MLPSNLQIISNLIYYFIVWWVFTIFGDQFKFIILRQRRLFPVVISLFFAFLPFLLTFIYSSVEAVASIFAISAATFFLINYLFSVENVKEKFI